MFILSRGGKYWMVCCDQNWITHVVLTHWQVRTIRIRADSNLWICGNKLGTRCVRCVFFLNSLTLFQCNNFSKCLRFCINHILRWKVRYEYIWKFHINMFTSPATARYIICNIYSIFKFMLKKRIRNVD